MSVLRETTNLHLTLYDSSGDLPSYLMHYSDDMGKLDEAYGNVDGRLIVLEETATAHDERLTNLETCCNDVNATIQDYGIRIASIEEVISTVSTQNIIDLQSRLGALENKVQTNTNDIHEINDNISEINTNITNLGNTLTATINRVTTVEGKITTLEDCCVHVQDRLTATELATAKNADDIGALQQRLTRDEANIQGNSDDIQILSTQVATNSHNIDDIVHALGDLDPTSQLEIVRQVTENTSAINQLQELTTVHTQRLDGYATRFTQDELRITDLERRMTSAEDALAQVEDWQTQIDNLQAAVDNVVDVEMPALTALVNGYDDRITALETWKTDDVDTFISSTSGTLTSYGTRISALESADVTLAARISNCETDILNNAGDITSLSADLTGVDNRVTAVETQIGNTDISAFGATITAAIGESFSRIATLQNSIRNIIGWDSVNATWITLQTTATTVIDAINELVNGASALDTRVGAIEDCVPSNASSSNQLATQLQLCPTGMITPFGGSSSPNGWLLCDGSAVSRDTYSELFAVIGTAYGAGDGSTTFNLPDLREATTKGVGLTSKSNNHYDSDGLALGEFVDDRVQNHNHQISDPGHNHMTNTWPGTGGEPYTGYGLTGNYAYAIRTSKNVTGISVSSNFNGTGRSGATTEVKAVGVNYIIKI